MCFTEYDRNFTDDQYSLIAITFPALTKFLPPKHEYVIKVRLSPLQIKLYTEYLDKFVHKKDQPPEEKKKLGAGGRLFQVRWAGCGCNNSRTHERKDVPHERHVCGPEQSDTA